MTAIDYLKQIRQIEDIVRHKLIEYKRWVDVAEGVGGLAVGDRVQSSRNLQQIPTAIGNYIDIEREINELRKKHAEIIRVIESLPQKEYNVIYKIFVEDCTMKEVAYHYGRSYDWVKLKKRSALKQIQAILDEKKGANR